MTEGRDAALVEFMGTFATVSENIESISDLSDGVALFEALSEIAPDYFDPTTIARHLGDNWALKSSNLRKLVRNLENYFRCDLSKEPDLEGLDLSAVARNGDVEQIAMLTEFVAAACVTCTEKGVYVQRIMSMSPESQVVMKGVIEQSMSRLTDCADEEEEEEVDENEMVFADEIEDVPEEKRELFGNTAKELEETRRELEAVKLKAAETAEENSKSNGKLQALVEDLQDRLMKRQDELIQVEEDLQQATSELADTKSKLAGVEEEKVNLEDDLDVAKAKTQQLYKAEATVAAYKKKLEGVGLMNQQMGDMADQTEKYLQQINELETAVKKATVLQKTVTSMETKMTALEKEKQEAESRDRASSESLQGLKTRLTAAETAKKTYEEELSELRAKLAVHTEGVTIETSGNAVVLEKENKALRDQVAKLQGGPVASVVSDGDAPMAIAVAAESPQVKSLKADVERLQQSIAVKEKENAKVSSDKDKLEAYTKRTLAKFQDKYLVALQECKAKLKEKQDKIEALEKRSQAERTAQKREERLLSSTIYELGMGIMQNRLKNPSEK